MSRWVNLLSLLPSTSLSLLVISIAFLRFYDATDFLILGQLANPRLWSNRLTVAALLVAVVNLGVEWNRRNRETDRLAQAKAERAADERRRTEDERRRSEDQVRAENQRAEERERQARRIRVETERDIALLSFLLDPSERNRTKLLQIITLLSEYQDSY